MTSRSTFLTIFSARSVSLCFFAVGFGLVFFAVGSGFAAVEGLGFLMLFTIKANKQREM